MTIRKVVEKTIAACTADDVSHKQFSLGILECRKVDLSK